MVLETKIVTLSTGVQIEHKTIKKQGKTKTTCKVINYKK